ncbi:MAG TPA: hypothetical protein V6C72_18600, partial [Chroococcales cyanobacterium]
RIQETIADILQRSRTTGMLPHEAADALAEHRLSEAQKAGSPKSFQNQQSKRAWSKEVTASVR